MKRLLLFAACFVLFALLACGGGEEPSSEPPPPTATRAPASRSTNTPVPPTATPVAVPHFTVNSEQVNVRTGPGTVFSIIGTVEQGDRFDVGGRNAAGDWLEFCCVNGQHGWIYAPLLIVNQEISSIPLAQDIPAAPVPTNTPVPSQNTPAPQPPPAQGGNALEMYDDNNNGRITCAEARAHGIDPVRRDHPAYQYMDDRDDDGIVCE
ncbi:MAG: excalibur calcium-binding domain-containing protein [Caldilineaceae bacterium]|nr:excalibur calcium-binding domain-containing protein [Caldilineaceae bacterium]MDE0462898.1 excalibur calcium-binding domain-containing protein [Caldilineaceae bacterium]